MKNISGQLGSGTTLNVSQMIDLIDPATIPELLRISGTFSIVKVPIYIYIYIYVYIGSREPKWEMGKTPRKCYSYR